MEALQFHFQSEDSAMKFCERVDGGGYKPTERRPRAAILRELMKQIEHDAASDLMHKHLPGDGWHYVPGEPCICHNGKYWFHSMPDSGGAILTMAFDLCELMNLNFRALYDKAYPDEVGDEPFTPSEADRAACARPVTLDDIPAVMDDLTDINWHSLRAVLEEAMEEMAVACPS